MMERVVAYPNYQGYSATVIRNLDVLTETVFAHCIMHARVWNFMYPGQALGLEFRIVVDFDPAQVDSVGLDAAVAYAKAHGALPLNDLPY